MRLGATLLLSVGLAMDAAAVSVALGAALPRVRWSHGLKVAGFFGGFQALMPLLGWAAGARFGGLLAPWGHWLAAAVFATLGAKMLVDGVRDAPTSVDSGEAQMAPRLMFVLAVATSLDAAVSGLALPFLGAPLVRTSAVIGATTACLSAAGLWAGHQLGVWLGRRLVFLGGLLLVGMALRALLL